MYDINSIEGYSWYSFHHTGDIYSPSKSIWNHNDLEKVNVWEVFCPYLKGYKYVFCKNFRNLLTFFSSYSCKIKKKYDIVTLSTYFFPRTQTLLLYLIIKPIKELFQIFSTHQNYYVPLVNNISNSQFQRSKFLGLKSIFV